MDNIPYAIIIACVIALAWMVRYQRTDAVRGIRRIAAWLRR